jgi:hypothetical protein
MVFLPQCVYPEIKDLTKSYQRLIGSPLFLQIWTYSDIAFAVLTLSQLCSAPLCRHYVAARRVLQCLKGTKTYRLHDHYGGSANPHEALLSHVDWAGNKTGRASISGFVWQTIYSFHL